MEGQNYMQAQDEEKKAENAEGKQINGVGESSGPKVGFAKPDENNEAISRGQKRNSKQKQLEVVRKSMKITGTFKPEDDDELAPYEVMDNKGKPMEICPQPKSTFLSKASKRDTMITAKASRRHSVQQQRDGFREESIYDNLSSQQRTKTAALHQSEWRIQNVGFQGEPMPVPTGTLALSADATKVAYGGILSGKEAPVRVHDFSSGALFEFRRPGLIAAVALFADPEAGSESNSSNGKAKDLPTQEGKIEPNVSETLNHIVQEATKSVETTSNREKVSSPMPGSQPTSPINMINNSSSFGMPFRVAIADDRGLAVFRVRPPPPALCSTASSRVPPPLTGTTEELFAVQRKNIKAMAVLPYASSETSLLHTVGADRDSTYLAVSCGAEVYVYNPDDFELIDGKKLESEVDSIAFTRSRRKVLLAAGERGNCVTIFQLSKYDGLQRVTQIHLSQRVTSVSFSHLLPADSKLRQSLLTRRAYKDSYINLLAVGGNDKTARVYTVEALILHEKSFPERIQAKKKQARFKKRKVPLDQSSRAASVSPTVTAQTSGLGADFIWEWEEVLSVQREDLVSNVVISKDGTKLAIADDSKQVAIYDIVSGAHLHDFPQNDRISGLQMCNQANTLAVGCFDSYATVYDIEHGLQLENYLSEAATVQSVALSSDGSRIAIGTRNGFTKVYHISEDDNIELFSYKNEASKPTWAVQLSANGEWLASGGYDNCARVFDVKQRSETAFMEFKTNFFIWGLKLLHQESDKQLLLAIGDWTGVVKTVKISIEEQNHEETWQIKMKDRIFSLDFNAEGTMLAIGNRDSTASLWDLTTKSTEPVAMFERTDRVYTTALSPKTSLNQPGLLACAGMDKTIAVYEIGRNQLITEYKRTALIHFLAFNSDGSLLGGVGDDRLSVVYCMKTMEPLIQIAHRSEVTSVSFCSSNSMAVACGSEVHVYGKGKNNYGITARPSFAFADTFLDDIEALELLVKSHPTTPNLRCPETGATLLHQAVREGNLEAVQVLLKANSVLGLIPDFKGRGAICQAIDGGQKEMIKFMLRAVLTKRISNLPGSLGQIFNLPFEYRGARRSSLSKLGDKFPDLFLQFLAGLKMENAGSLIKGHVQTAKVREPIYLVCSRRGPRHLWESYLKEQGLLDTLLSGLVSTGEKQQTFATKINDSFGVAVDCFRVPVQDFNTAIQFKDIINYAERTKDLTVFEDGTIVTAILDYKKPIYMDIFKKQMLQYIFWLVISCFWGFAMAKTRLHSWKELTAMKSWAGASVVLFPFVIIGCVVMIQKEIHQFKSEYEIGASIPGMKTKNNKKACFVYALEHHFGSIWNVNDFLALFFTSLAIIMYALRIIQMNQFASIGIILLVLKLLYYARAYSNWSLVVRTLLKVIQSISHIFQVLCLIVFGFALSYLILIGSQYKSHEEESSNLFRNPLVAVLSTTLFVFGEYGALEDYVDLENYSDGGGLAVILLVVLLMVVVVLLLNVVIAKMGDTYAEVRDSARLEARLEIAKIIVELEQDSPQRLLPWLHCLQPREAVLMEKEEDHMLNSASIQIMDSGLRLQVQALTDKIEAFDNLRANFEALVAKMEEQLQGR